MFDQKFLSNKLDKFVALLDIDAVVEYEFFDQEDSFLIKVLFKGDNLGYAIGNRGKNIQSMQYVLSLMLKSLLKNEGEHSDEDVSKVKIIVDIGDYREKQNQKLRKMVDGKIDDVKTLGEYIDLPPMQASERREVHMYIREIDGIESESVGEGKERAVRITPAQEEEEA